MRHRTAATVAALVVLAALVPAGVGAAAATTQEDCAFPLTTTDATGTEITVEERPERITTLTPSAAQTMWALDAEAQVVGMTRYASYLDGAEDRTNVSAGFSTSVEAVIGTEPDLVLAPNVTRAETVTALRDAGVTVFKFELASSISDVRNKTTLIGRLTGNCAAAERTNAWMDANVEAAREATADVERPRVLYPLGGGYVANTNTFVSGMIEAGGGVNAMAGTNFSLAYPQVNDEVVLREDPEVLLTSSRSGYPVGEEPYASTTAGRNNRTVYVDNNYLTQPAPRSIVYGVRNITRGLHPDAAADAAFVAKDDVTLATATPTETASATADPTATPTDSPGQTGFGVAVAVVALAGAALLARRE
ncbi:PGF-CTERM-anchored ABC transporter substrate-binding protein [Halosegnis marinus]|uniref:PGF-CTERM-anchored ABC transporter substrate-binding protein n=1 Tax=Halosegnis marinus TaxID=3034023 RepID=A0ABD5ZS42_9EURY|nr:PGF-CTERM-anchored ABC transporter substrate-binding protein [Halosegnis sp. DT85]